MLFLDPPYNISKDFGKIKFKKRPIKDYGDYIWAILGHFKHAVKEGGSIFFCGDWQMGYNLFEAMDEHFKPRNRLTWQREKGRGSKTNWKAGCEDIWWATKGNNYKFYVERIKIRRQVVAPYKEGGKAKDWDEETGFRDTHPSNFMNIFSVPFWSMPENTPHPTQKPEKLLAMLMLATTDPGDLVVDPFLGSGTTAAVASKLGRNFLGCDIDEDWCLYTLRRLELAQEGKEIQGYSDGVFWERNTLKYQSS